MHGRAAVATFGWLTVMGACNAAAGGAQLPSTRHVANARSDESFGAPMLPPRRAVSGWP